MLHWLRACRSALVVLLLVAPLSAQAPQHFTLTPDLRIDAGTANLSPVTWLAVSRTGIIAVGQAQDNLIRFFDARGQSLGTFGRPGAGPGEFRNLNPFEVGWLADTLWVGDALMVRFSLITPDRKLLRTVPGAIDVKSPGESSGSIEVFGSVSLYADGSQLVEGWLPKALADRPAWGRDPQHRGDRIVLFDVSAQQRFQRLVGYEVHDDCGMNQMSAYALCGHPIFGVDRTGSRMAWVAPSYAGPDSGTYRVTMFSRTGAVIYQRSYPFVPQAIPAHIRDSLIARGNADRRPALAPPMGPTFGPPAIYPGAESIVIGADGSAWVRSRATPAGTPWVILSPRGDAVGTVLAPSNITIMVVGQGVVWGTSKDADDVESVVRYRVGKGKSLSS